MNFFFLRFNGGHTVIKEKPLDFFNTFTYLLPAEQNFGDQQLFYYSFKTNYYEVENLHFSTINVLCHELTNFFFTIG